MCSFHCTAMESYNYCLDKILHSSLKEKPKQLQCQVSITKHGTHCSPHWTDHVVHLPNTRFPECCIIVGSDNKAAYEEEREQMENR